MSNKGKMSNKDKKIYIIFVVLLACSVGLGFLVGTVGAKAQDSISAFEWPLLASRLCLPLTLLFVIGSLTSCIVDFVLISGVKKRTAEVNDLDDDVYEGEICDLEYILSEVNVLGYLCFIFAILAMTVSFGLSDFATRNGLNVTFAAQIIALIGLVEGMIALGGFHAEMVKQLKIIDPEKKGNVLDFRFRKEWLASMDEAELVRNAFASQRGFIAGIYACLILWVVAFLSMLIFHTGMLAIFCVAIILITMIMAESFNRK